MAVQDQNSILLIEIANSKNLIYFCSNVEFFVKRWFQKSSQKFSNLAYLFYKLDTSEESYHQCCFTVLKPIYDR